MTRVDSERKPGPTKLIFLSLLPNTSLARHFALRAPAGERGNNHVERPPTTRVHTHRASCGYCHHCNSGCDPLPRLRPGAGEGAADDVPLQHEAARPRADHVPAGLRRSLSVQLVWTDAGRL